MTIGRWSIALKLVVDIEARIPTTLAEGTRKKVIDDSQDLASKDNHCCVSHPLWRVIFLPGFNPKSHTTMSAFPPQRSIPSIQVPQDIALKYLTLYLTDAQTTPYLLPNARLEPSGPTAGSSSSSITIHNLKRIEAGLRGETLAPTLDLDGGYGRAVKVAKGMDDGVDVGVGAGEADTMHVEGWQDLDEYQREQESEEGDVGDTQTGVAQEGDEVDAQVVPTTPVRSKQRDVGTPRSKTPKEKEARKAEKKARHKEELRKKNKEKGNGNDFVSIG